ncbi:tetratricopeptide repeat protein [Pedobacter nutrimenti]|uniref:Tetratricopeptide repeat protein n=1 Tax=Pedobacter nutrimenti TaxID=1241337 RepID=A0A318UME7_9SPHI|nr:tetratricopeptide repeat protein [Pedobacter nutrimenti]PYF76961.1 tetratricopeptide repeat protein [Pedobacter nutrimenti]
MKKVLFSILFAGAATLAHAQKSEVADAKKEWGLFQITMNQKPSLEKTLAALNSGLKHTDNAIANEKSKNMPEAWSYRALFASAIAASDTTNFENSSAKQKIAEEAVAKAKELDTKGDEKANISTAEINISNAIKLRAFTAYNKKDYAGALKYFNEATEKNPSDTSMYLNAAIMARNIKNYPEAIKNFKKVISFNTPNAKDLYSEIINLSLSELKDTVGGIALLKEASAKFPDAEGFIQTETQLYINKGDIVKSEEMLNKLVAKDPKNPTYQYLMGDVYYQQAVEVQNKKNKLDSKKVKEANTMVTQITALLDKALPYYLKSSELDPKYAPALEALKRVYAFKNDTPKYEAVKKKLEALKP